MSEDAGKKRFIKEFLHNIEQGEGAIDDIRIERAIKLPGSDGQGSIARSLSGREIFNITQLLEDDLKHTFDEGFFTFRFVAAVVGSGKTSLLKYLENLAETKLNYSNSSILVNFQLSDLLKIESSSSFTIKFYCHILAYTFWELLHKPSLSKFVRETALEVLKELLEDTQFSQVISAKNFDLKFYPKFTKYVAESGVSVERFFFQVIREVAKVEPKFTFIYLTDELDSLQNFPTEFQETRALFKSLIKAVAQQFSSKIKLLIYLVGTSNNVQSFVGGDSVIESLVGRDIIELNKGYSHEFELIKSKINDRIYGAYKGYKNFSEAWQAIQNISIKSAVNLREFCQKYASEVLKIHENYFQEAPEQKFEGNARELVEAKCREHWGNYLKKSSYSLSKASTTTVIANHAFDCYVELLHNGVTVARAFGEAKNYELLTGHLQTFETWLKDAKCELTSSQEHPPDLAFMIAPSCPTLLQRKLELKNIHFIKSDKFIKSDTQVVPTIPVSKPTPVEKKIPVVDEPVNINTASREQLINAFKGTGIKQNTIDLLINFRKTKPYTNLDELTADLKSTNNVKKKLQDKLNKGIICF